jgi:RNA polymerase sigma factor (sigma-70 family)
MDAVEGILHPRLYQKTLRQVGISLGQRASRRYQETHRSSKPFSPQDYIHCIEGLKEQWGWDCSPTEATTDAVTFTVPVCPFGDYATNAPNVCLIESGILGGIAAEHFGESKVAIHRGAGDPPRGCRLVVYLRKSEQSVAAEGETYPDERLPRHERVPKAEQEPSLAKLSARERQIVRLVGEGLSNKEIAAALHLSVRTVEGHLSRIHAKLEVKGRTDLIRLALRSQLASL